VTAAQEEKMVVYRYHVVPFMGVIKGGMFSTENAQTVSSQLQSLIDHYARQGWEFHSLAKADVLVKPGCLGSLLGHSAAFLTFDQVIFRQQVSQ
jgi:hypothetical protein